MWRDSCKSIVNTRDRISTSVYRRDDALVPALKLSSDQHVQLAAWITARVPDIGSVDRIEELRPPRHLHRIAYFRVHAGRRHIDVAAKRPSRYQNVDEGVVELQHLLSFFHAGSTTTPLPLGYDAESGILWTIVMPGRALQDWLYLRLQMPFAQAENEAHTALRLAGRWLQKAHNVPFFGRASRAYPFLRTPESDFPAVISVEILDDAEVTLVKEMLVAARDFCRKPDRLVWTHGDFGPGNCLVSRLSGELQLGVLDFANPFGASPMFDFASFSASIAVSGSVRFIGADKIRRAQEAFAAGYLNACAPAVENGFTKFPRVNSWRECAFHEAVATLKLLGRYAQRFPQFPMPLRWVLRAHLRRTVTTRMLALARLAIEGSDPKVRDAAKQRFVFAERM